MFSAGLLMGDSSGIGVRGGRASREKARELVLPIPVLPGTVLGFRRLLQGWTLDLRAASELLRKDPGALLHLLRLVAKECPEAEGRPERLEECLASVPLERLLRRLERATDGRGQWGAFDEYARHAAEIARRAETVGESLGLERERAWLLGMLHELGDVPGLPADRVTQERDRVKLCARIGRQYGLSKEMREALGEVHRGTAGSVWAAVIAAAHELEPAA